MAIDITQPESPGWWLARLLKKLAAERGRYDQLDIYYRGDNGIPVHADKAVRLAYRRLMRMSRTNFAELTVEAVRERMRPVGFRTGADGDELGDREAWRIWQANSLDADSSLVDRSTLAMSKSYVMVGPIDTDLDAPLITPEDPREVTVESVPGRRRKSAAALKIFRDTYYGVDRAFLYLPGLVFQAARQSSNALNATENVAPAAGYATSTSSDDTIELTVEGFEWSDISSLPPGVIPVVEFPNRADTHGRTMGEFEPHLPILDRINYSILNRLEIATLQAFRQRAIKGVPTRDQNGEEIDYDDIFSADPGAMWQLPDTAELWESGVVDLGPIRNAIRDDVQDLAAVTRTPLFYLTPDAANGSAEGASLAREGLVFKTTDRISERSESWEQVMSLAFLFAGDTDRAKRADMEVLWAPPDRVSMAERYDAAVKAKAADVPWRTRMMDILGFSPQQVTRMEAELAGEALLTLTPFEGGLLARANESTGSITGAPPTAP